MTHLADVVALNFATPSLVMRSIIQRWLCLILGLGLVVLIGSRWEVRGSAAEPPLDIGTRIEQIEQDWQAQYEAYFDTQLRTPSLTADQIAETLSQLTNQTGKKLGLLYLFPQEQELETVLVLPGITPIRQTLADVSRPILLQVVEDFNAQVTRSLGTGEFLAPAVQLYQWIIAPLEVYLQAQQIDTLLFCVGPNLRSLPFAALHDGHQFLIEKYSLGLIPAFNLINSNYRGVQRAQVLAMGASEFKSLNALPAVPLELSTVVKDLGQGQIFLNQEFTLDNLKKQLDSRAFAIVHLATHAEFQPGSPDESYIQLWQDDRLNLNQLRQLDWHNLPVELLVLSACQTALGDRQAELGFAGLSFQAGVKSALASLWQVSDLGTLALMQEFYQQLTRPDVTTKAEALRNAQIAMLRRQVFIDKTSLHGSRGSLPLPPELEQMGQPNLALPYYWAGFVLVGSPW